MRCSSSSRLKNMEQILSPHVCLMISNRQVDPSTRSFFQSTNVRYQRINLWFGDFLSKGRHLSLAIHDGIEYSLIAYASLPLGVGQIARMFHFALERFGPAISSMA